MNRIQLLLIEQDYCLRINCNGMTITDRRKADCWKLGQEHGLHNQTGRATVPKVKKALEELVWVMYANFADDYTPSHGTKKIFSEDFLSDLRADAFAERERMGMPVPE
jgi:hypothetical protein